MKRLFHGAACNAIQSVCDSGQLIHHLIGHSGTVQNNRSSVPDLQHGPRRDSNNNEHDGQKLLLPRNDYGSSEQMYRKVREHFLSSRLGYFTL